MLKSRPMFKNTRSIRVRDLRYWLAASASLLGVSFGLAQNRSIPEGSKPYVPSRLEWLAVELNSGLRVELSEATQYSMDFVPIAKDNAILIYVVYFPGVQREVMNKTIDTAKKLIDMRSKARGWSSWLKVQEHVEMKELKPPR